MYMLLMVVLMTRKLQIGGVAAMNDCIILTLISTPDLCFLIACLKCLLLMLYLVLLSTIY